MDNELNEQVENPVIEKVSLKEIKQEQNKLSPEEEQVIENLINAMANLEGKALEKFKAFIQKKLDILKNNK